MSDILKEAIADAKAVRETALQNAKMALEEAFTPQLKSMLSAKLREEEDEEVPEEMAGMDELEDEPEEGYMEDEDAEEVQVEVKFKTLKNKKTMIVMTKEKSKKSCILDF